MSKLENKWVVEKDNLSILLPNFFVKIDCPQVEENPNYRLRAIHTSNSILGYDFDSLGDAMYFTEHSIAKCQEVYDVIDEYKKHYIHTESKSMFDDEPFVLRKRRRNNRF